MNATAEVDDQSQYPLIIGVCTALTALSVVVVGGRLWIRSKVRGLASDDHMALLSEVFVVVYAALTIARESPSRLRCSSGFPSIDDGVQKPDMGLVSPLRFGQRTISSRTRV